MTDALTAADYSDAADMFQDAVVANLADEENLDSVKSDFQVMVSKRWHQGSFVVSVEKLIFEHLWSRVNAKAGRTTAVLVRDIVHGQTTLDADEWLDQVITVGKHRRTTVRNLNRDDLIRIKASRVDNRDKAQAALDMTDTAVTVIGEALDEYGEVARWIAAESPIEFHATPGMAQDEAGAA